MSRAPLSGHESTKAVAILRTSVETDPQLSDDARRWKVRAQLSADWHWSTDAALLFNWSSSDSGVMAGMGIRPADLLGRRIDDLPFFVPPPDGWDPVLARMVERQPLRDVLFEASRGPGRSFWVALSARPHTDEQGVFVGYVGVACDVTEQQLLRQRLAESERRHEMLGALSSEWYWQSDSEHRIEQVGAVAAQRYGHRVDEVIGKTRWDLAPSGASHAAWALHRADLAARRPFRNFEYAVQRTGQAQSWISVGGNPRFDARGAFCGYHGVGLDITLRKRAERLLLGRTKELERQVSLRTAELEQSNRDLEAFSRQLAHELRTPISQVAGLADLLRSQAWERLVDKEREWLRLQGQAAREMSQTITTLLEMARSASIPLVVEPTDLSALARIAIADLPETDRVAPIEWDIAPGLLAQCSAALARVVLNNLLGNAAKFTRDVAAPRIELGIEPGDEGCFFVQDNGVGFDAERGDSLFQPFTRLHAFEDFHGTGLGLSIVRRIAERHGGCVSASGALGKGARIMFRLAPPADDGLPEA